MCVEVELGANDIEEHSAGSTGSASDEVEEASYGLEIGRMSFKRRASRSKIMILTCY